MNSVIVTAIVIVVIIVIVIVLETIIRRIEDIEMRLNIVHIVAMEFAAS